MIICKSPSELERMKAANKIIKKGKDQPEECVRQLEALGYPYARAVELLKPDFAGRRFDGALLDALPSGIDPCGENGEFHSFVSAGPMLARRIAVRVGETVEREGFAYADLLPA